MENSTSRERRTPALFVYLAPDGTLYAEGTSANGARRKIVINDLMDLKADLIEQSQIERQRQIKLAAERHAAVFTTTATVHGTAFAARTIQGKIPQPFRRSLKADGFTVAEINQIEADGRQITGFFTHPAIAARAEREKSTPKSTKKSAKRSFANQKIDLSISIDDLE